ncbi:hypothetical protein [Caminibacter pacificus]|jgi:hypothetical protein
MNKIYKIAGMLSGTMLLAGCCCVQPQSQCNSCNDTKPNPINYQAVNNPVIPQYELPQKPQTSKVEKKLSGACAITNIPGLQKNCVLRVEAVGVGVAPAEGMESTAQAMAMARRAAILEAYKALAEKLYGIKINGRETLKNMMLQNESLRAYIQGVIRGANIEEESYNNGMYKVVMSLKVNVKEWNKYLEENPPYSLSSM